MLDDAAFGAATEVTPKFISPADPAARWTGAHGGQAFFAYATNYLIDTDHAIIIDVEATTAVRQAEVLAAKRMIERTMEGHALYPARLAGDSAYGSAEMLGWLVYQHGIEPHVTVFDKSARTDGTFARELPLRSSARSPPLSRRQDAHHDGHARERRRDAALSRHQGGLRRLCLEGPGCPSTPLRKVPRSIHEGARDMARAIAKSPEGRMSRRLRKEVEMLFAHLKRILKLDRLRLRGPTGARDEFLLAATAQNRRKLAKLVPILSPSPRLSPVRRASARATDRGPEINSLHVSTSSTKSVAS